MEPTELLGYIAGVLERLGIEYAVVGSMASSFYGESRLTNDVDVLAQIRPLHLPAFLHEFPGDQFYISEDAARQAIAANGQFNIIHPESGLKIDVIIPSPSSYDLMRMHRRIRAKPRGAPFDVFFASPEDVILKKMEFYREGGSEKHLRDITGMLKISGDTIDRAYIADWAKVLGLTEIWDAILARLGPSLR